MEESIKILAKSLGEKKIHVYVHSHQGVALQFICMLHLHNVTICYSTNYLDIFLYHLGS